MASCRSHEYPAQALSLNSVSQVPSVCTNKRKEKRQKRQRKKEKKKKGKAQHRAFRFSFLRVRTPELAILSLTPFQLICYPLTPSDLATIWFRHEQTLSLTVGRLVATIGTGMRADNPLNACVRLRRTTSPVALRDIYTAPDLLWPSGSRQPSTPQRVEVEVKLLKFIQQRDGGGTAPR